VNTVVLGQYLQASAQIAPEKIGLICGGRRQTYRELAAASNAFANFLIAEGLRTGDRVALCLENSPEMVVTMFGVWQAGGCIVAINPQTPAERVGFLVEHCSASFFVCASNKFQVVREALGKCANPPRMVFAGNELPDYPGKSFESIIAAECALPKKVVRYNDLAAIIYTSGSTGRPKGATLTHRNVDAVVTSVTASIGYGLLQLLVTLKSGGTLVLEKGFGFPYEIIKRIKEEKITGFAGVPTVFSILTQFSRLDKEDFSSLRYITNAAAAMPPSFIPKLQNIFPTAQIFLMHGLTECLRTTYLPPEEIGRRPTSVGKGMHNVQLWIENSEGKKLSAGETGELVVFGPNLMNGYWNDPENTDKVLRYNTYVGAKALYSGDLFTMDEDGFFYFVARADEVIKCKGMKVSPLEVEDVIYRLEEVQEVRVMGVPDNLLGQAIRAELVLKKGCELNAETVREHCRKHLEEYKLPQAVEFVESLPKSAGGKIKRLAHAGA
jgi:acyl-CoA synthetase (AMP-forming)/AMP-acid ligase II